MTKKTVSEVPPERLLDMDHTEELFLDLNQSMKLAEGDVPERVEYLRDSLLHGLGILTARPWSASWSEEEKEKGINILKWCFHYRNELRIFINEYQGHDCTEARARWRFVTDEKFGPSAGPPGSIH